MKKNKINDLQYIKQTISLLNSMVASGECHSDESILMKNNAIDKINSMQKTKNTCTGCKYNGPGDRNDLCPICRDYDMYEKA